MGLADVDIDHNKAAAAKQRDPNVRPLCPPSNDRLWIRARGDLPISDARDLVGSAWNYSPAAAGILQDGFKHRLSPVAVEKPASAVATDSPFRAGQKVIDLIHMRLDGGLLDR